MKRAPLSSVAGSSQRVTMRSASTSTGVPSGPSDPTARITDAAVPPFANALSAYTSAADFAAT